MKKLGFFILLFWSSLALVAQQVPKFIYSDNMANESLRKKPLTVKGKLVAVNRGEMSDYYFFVEKRTDKTILACVKNEGDFFNKDAPKFVTNVLYYHFSPSLLKKIKFAPNTEEEYSISANDNQAIPFEEISENKIKMKRAGFGETDEDGYELMGIQMIYIGKFKTKAEFENFQKEFLR